MIFHIESLSSHDATLEKARCVRANTVRGILARPLIREGAKMAALALAGLIAIAVYSAMETPSTAGIDDALLNVVVFAAAAVSSVAGFAFSALCGAALFHSGIHQVQIVRSMLLASISIQTLMITGLWRVIEWRNVARLLIGGLMGVPLGILLLLEADPHKFAKCVGLLLCLYAGYMICRPPVVLPKWMDRADPLVGFLGGLTGGAVAFPGAPVTAWCQLKGWSRDRQRGVYQPYILLMQVGSLAMMAMLSRGKAQAIGPAGHDLLIIPPALAGAAIGMFVYRKCTDRAFLLVLNLLLAFSGASLLLL